MASEKGFLDRGAIGPLHRYKELIDKPLMGKRGFIGLDSSGLWKLIEWAEFMQAWLTENNGIRLDDDGPLQVERAARIHASTTMWRIRELDRMALTFP
jgi:hypothetical protein